jgi:hypothetical protein
VLADLNARVANLSSRVKWALGLAAALVVSPIIFLVVKGMVGLALAALIGLAVINFAPVLSLKFANWKLRGLKHEAATNPVETLQNQLVDKRAALAQFARSITDFKTEVANFGDKVEVFKRQQPQNAERFVAQHAGMVLLLRRREQRYRQADQELDMLEQKIEQASSLWDMAMAAQRMNKLAGVDPGQQFDKILQDVAFDSVQSNVNRAFAELETSLLEEPQQLEAPKEFVALVTEIQPAKEKV